MEKDWLKEYEEKKQKNLKEAKIRLRKFCALLKPLKIDSVELVYDGCGDSGAIEEVTFYSGEKEYKGELPDKKYKSEWSKDQVDFKSALEETCYQFLPDGWEINEGSFGTLKIDVNAKSLKVEHNERYEEVNFSEEDIKL